MAAAILDDMSMLFPVKFRDRFVPRARSRPQVRVGWVQELGDAVTDQVAEIQDGVEDVEKDVDARVERWYDDKIAEDHEISQDQPGDNLLRMEWPF